jgi:hypothetical protein
VYNVWLVQQIKTGAAPGLSLAATHTNILFDRLLDVLVVWFGFGMGTRIGLAISVLVYTGGQLALWRKVAPLGWRAVAPLAVMLSYGWLFAVGFINFYIALGLGYYATALLWRGPRTWARWGAAIALLALGWLAHFVAVLMMAGVIVYAIVSERRSRKVKIGLFAAAAVLLVMAHVVLRFIYGEQQYTLEPQWRLGTDQVWLFSGRYARYSLALATLWIIGLVTLIRSKGARVVRDRVLHIYLLVALAGVLAPWGIRWVSYSVTLGLFPGRVTAIAAVFGCAVAARAQFRRRVLLFTSVVLVAFLLQMHRDQREVYEAEQEIEGVIARLPAGARVVSDVDWPIGRVQMWHLMDRACIGRVWDFGNYEAASGHFRIRAAEGNTILTWVPPEVDPVSTAALLKGRGVRVFEIYDDDEGHYHAREIDPAALPDVD